MSEHTCREKEREKGKGRLGGGERSLQSGEGGRGGAKESTEKLRAAHTSVSCGGKTGVRREKEEGREGKKKKSAEKEGQEERRAKRK